MNTDKIIAESIAKEYAPKDNSKIIALKKLDNRAKLPAVVFAYSFGIASALVVGIGMCLAMQVLGSGVAGLVLGIIIGIIGFVGCGINYPLYKKSLKRAKQSMRMKLWSLPARSANSKARKGACALESAKQQIFQHGGTI